MFSQYFNWVDEYQSLLGPNTIVLGEYGNFLKYILEKNLQNFYKKYVMILTLI